MTINYLCLDIGNVLVNLDMEPFIKCVSIQANISKSDAKHFTNTIQIKQDLGMSNISDELVSHFNIKSEYIIDNIVDSWNQVVKPNHQAIDFFNQLIIKYKIKVALLSNIGIDHVRLLNRDLRDEPVYRDSIHHFSCDVGARKPTALYYQSFLASNPEFKYSLYLDDLIQNVVAGNNSGLSGMRFDLSIPENFECEKEFVNNFYEKV